MPEAGNAERAVANTAVLRNLHPGHSVSGSNMNHLDLPPSRRRFQAQKTGYFVDQVSCKGTVVSLYEKAVNILLEERLLVSLVAGPWQMTGLSIEVPALFRPSSAVPDGLEYILRPGARMDRRQSCLFILETQIDLSRAERWRGVPPLPSAEVLSPARIETLEASLAACGRKGGLLAAVLPGSADNPFAARTRRILNAVSCTGRPPVLRGLSPLVGCGPGFTPSGDDFLCGVLLGERLVPAAGEAGTDSLRRCEGLRVSHEDRSGIRARLERTSRGGATLLWQALQGHFPGYLVDTAEGLSCPGSQEELVKVVGRAAGHGETSGSDALAGLLWYLKRVIRIL
jgi:hypothetical protein